MIRKFRGGYVEKIFDIAPLSLFLLFAKKFKSISASPSHPKNLIIGYAQNNLNFFQRKYYHLTN